MTNLNVWILTEVEVVSNGDDVSSWSQVYVNQELAVSAMQRQISEKIKHNAENSYPEIQIDHQDESGAELSTLDNDRWLFKLEAVEIQPN